MANDKTTYRIDGFSCANCARTFEKNVQQIKGVEDAQVNFGASKITVQGAATVEDIEKAGAFEQLKVVNASGPAPERQSFFKKHHSLAEGEGKAVAGGGDQGHDERDRPSLWTHTQKRNVL